MTKLKASLIHFIISALFILLFLALVYFVWYDKVFIDISGVSQPLILLVVIDVILGPLLTLLVYKKGKSSLKFDLTVIALLQISAFVFGAFTVFSGKPSLMIFNDKAYTMVIEDEYAKSTGGFKLSRLYSSVEYRVFDSMQDRFNLTDYTAFMQKQPIDEYGYRFIENQQLDFGLVLKLTQLDEQEVLELLGVNEKTVSELGFYYIINDGEYWIMAVDKSNHNPLKVLPAKF